MHDFITCLRDRMFRTNGAFEKLSIFISQKMTLKGLEFIGGHCVRRMGRGGGVACQKLLPLFPLAEWWDQFSGVFFQHTDLNFWSNNFPCVSIWSLLVAERLTTICKGGIARRAASSPVYITGVKHYNQRRTLPEIVSGWDLWRMSYAIIKPYSPG